jgi:hypothetical protein
LQTLYITVPPRQFYGTRFMNYGPLPYGGGGGGCNFGDFFIKYV